MQESSTTTIKKEYFPFELSVLAIGHNHNEARSIEQFHEYNHEASERISSYTKKDNGDDFILSGKSCFFSYVCKYALQ